MSLSQFPNFIVAPLSRFKIPTNVTNSTNIHMRLISNEFILCIGSSNERREKLLRLALHDFFECVMVCEIQKMVKNNLLSDSFKKKGKLPNVEEE